MTDMVSGIQEKDPDEMTQAELNDLFFNAINGLMISQQKVVESINNINETLKNVSGTFETHETCITQLQEAVIELRRMMDTMQTASSDSYSHVSKGGIILQ